jgi:hypothetical protein
VVFGPLHRAITEARLPRGLWSELGKIAPPAEDPAVGLSRLLIIRARDERWRAPALRRALRGSGPHVKQLKAEIGNEKNDPFVVAAKTALK